MIFLQNNSFKIVFLLTIAWLVAATYSLDVC